MAKKKMKIKKSDPEFVTKGLSNGDFVVIFTTFSFMMIMVPLLRLFNFMYLFLLNLLHGISVYLALKDLKRSIMSLFLGLLYLISIFGIKSPNISVPFASFVVMLWMVMFHKFGYPEFSWILFPCSTIWCFSFFIGFAYELVHYYAVARTLYCFLFVYGKKSAEDSLLGFTLITMHLIFVEEELGMEYLVLSYGLCIAWMLLKSVSRLL